MLYYLDDFFAILLLQANIEAYYYDFERIYSYLNIIINYFKDIIGTKADFLGIELDSILI